jgi:hypothetical protein
LALLLTQASRLAERPWQHQNVKNQGEERYHRAIYEPGFTTGVRSSNAATRLQSRLRAPLETWEQTCEKHERSVYPM